GLALHVNGASRWIDLGTFSFQPSELLKIAFIIYAAAWAQLAKERIKTMRSGLLPYIAMVGVLSALLLAQRDTDTLLIIAMTGLAIFCIAGMPLRHAAIALLLMGAMV